MTIYQPDYQERAEVGVVGVRAASQTPATTADQLSEWVKLNWARAVLCPHQSRSPSNAQHPIPAKQGGGDTVRNAKLNCTLKYSHRLGEVSTEHYAAVSREGQGRD